MKEYEERLTKLKANQLNELIDKLQSLLNETDITDHNKRLYSKWLILAIREQNERRMRREHYLRFH